MKILPLVAATAMVALLSTHAFAEDDRTAGVKVNAGTETQRDVNQQTRIESGLDSGALNAKETSRLEKGEARIDHVEAKSMKDGTLSASEKLRIEKMQDAESKAIYNQKHDAQNGNPDSKTSQRLQADVQRNVNQETRINNGIENGSLSNKEAAKLERGQSRSDARESNAAKDGHVGVKEEAKIRKTDAKDSAKIYRKKQTRRQRG